MAPARTTVIDWFTTLGSNAPVTVRSVLAAVQHGERPDHGEPGGNEGTFNAFTVDSVLAAIYGGGSG